MLFWTNRRISTFSQYIRRVEMKNWFIREGKQVMLAALLSITLVCVAKTAQAGAAVAIEPSSGKKSTPITLAGTGFQPMEEVEIVITLGPGQRVGLGTAKVDVIVADDKGAFSVPSNIPRIAKPGVYPIDVEGNKGSMFSTTIAVTE